MFNKEKIEKLEQKIIGLENELKELKEKYVITGRHGILEVHFTGQGSLNKGQQYSVIAEVEEIGKLNNYSKVKILSKSGNTAIKIEDIPEWLLTKEIIWEAEKE